MEKHIKIRMRNVMDDQERRFGSLGELHSWLEAEHLYWKDLTDEVDKQKISGTARDNVRTLSGYVGARLNDVNRMRKAVGEDQVRHPDLQSFITEIQSDYFHVRIIPSDSKSGKLVAELCKKDGAMAWGAQSYLDTHRKNFGKLFQSDSPSAFDGFMAAALMNLGVSTDGSASAYKARIDDLIERCEKQLQNLKDEDEASSSERVTERQEFDDALKTFKDASNYVLEEFSNRSDAASKSLDMLISKAGEDLEKHKAESTDNLNKKIEELEEHYRQHLALKGPKDFWLEQEDKHEKKAWWLGFWFYAWSIVGGSRGGCDCCHNDFLAVYCLRGHQYQTESFRLALSDIPTDRNHWNCVHYAGMDIAIV